MTIQVKDAYTEVYQALQQDIDEILHRHAVEQIQLQLSEAKQNVQRWQKKYGCDYETFIQRTANDRNYLQRLNGNTETQMWEGDLISWEFDTLEVKTWQTYLQKLSTI